MKYKDDTELMLIYYCSLTLYAAAILYIIIWG
jgi:hypothetical protein